MYIPFILISCFSFSAEAGGDFFFDSVQAHFKILKCSIPQFVSVFCWCLSILLHSHPAKTSASRSTNERHVHSTAHRSVQLMQLTGLHIAHSPDKNIPPSLHLHCSHLAEERQHWKKASRCSAQLRFDRPWEFKCFCSS